jgi:hypothetical protein
MGLSVSALAIGFVFAGAAAAQSDPNAIPNTQPRLYQPTSTYPVDMGHYEDHASTYAEGVQRGRAAVIQALANYQLSESQAEILREQAWALDRENRLQQTQALFAQLDMFDKARIKAREQREVRLATGQKKLEERRATLYRSAFQLSPAEFDPTTGAINWPSALQGEKYQVVRERVEEMFRMQIAYHDSQPGRSRDIARSIDLLKRALNSDVSRLSKSDFLAASKFLAGLDAEARSLATSA